MATDAEAGSPSPRINLNSFQFLLVPNLPSKRQRFFWNCGRQPSKTKPQEIKTAKKILHSASDVTVPIRRFRWCRVVPCQAKEIHLILTSVTGVRIPLEWKSDLGWYESDLVSLPSGLHFGFLLIKRKVKPSFLESTTSTSSTVVNERDYKIDPFFVSAHKYAVELFVQSDRSGGIWTDNPLLREKYSSSHHLETQRDNKDKEVAVGVSVSPRKWSSHQELRKCVCWEEPEERRDTRAPHQGQIDAVLASPSEKWREEDIPKSKWTSRGSSSGIGLGEGADESLLSPSGDTSLRKWSSLGEREDLSERIFSPDSFYYSRSRSLQIESVETRTKHGRKKTLGGTVKAKSDGSQIDDLKQDRYIKRALQSDAEFDRLRADTLARVQAVESLLRQSDDEAEAVREGRVDLFFKEINPSRSEGYGCLITFESRSTSMDDLGSPRALEDVLVSLTSSDTEPRAYSSIPVTGTETLLVEHLQVPQNTRSLPHPFRLEQETRVSPSESDASFQGRVPEDENDTDNGEDDEEICQDPESDFTITINEDQNFQYDSLKNEDQNIPLNIRAVLDSEDSSDYTNLNVETRGPLPSPVNAECSSHRESASGDSATTPPREESIDEGLQGKRRDSYSLRKHRSTSPSSAKGAVATDPLILVHPGSLRSETVTESSGTLVETRKGSQPIRKDIEGRNLEQFKRSLRKERVWDKGSHLKRVSSPPRQISGSSIPHRLPAKEQEKSSISKKSLATPGKTIVIIRDRKNPKMNSTATQTSHRGSTVTTSNRLAAHRSLPSSFASKYKDRSMFSPLPDKVNGPWTTAKYVHEREPDNYPYFENSSVKKLQKNLYNIARADQILRKIHPFDYRPTLVHKHTRSESVPSDILRSSPIKRAFKPTKSVSALRNGQSFNTYRKSQSFSNFRNGQSFNISRNGRSFNTSRNGESSNTSTNSQCFNISKDYQNLARKDQSYSHFRNSENVSKVNDGPITRPLSTSAHMPSMSSPSLALPPYNSPVQNETIRTFTSTSTLKRVPRPIFSIYGKDYSSSDESRSRVVRRIETDFGYHPAKRSNVDSFPIRPVASLPDLRGTHEDTHVPQPQFSRAKYTTRTFSSSPTHTRKSELGENVGSRSYTSLRTRRRSLEDTFRLSGSSSGSTDSLIEEAEDATRSFLYSSKGDSSKWASRRKSAFLESYSYAPRTSTPKMKTVSFTATESSVADCLRARSETDLRMIGKLSGGHQGEPPYLPYSRKELSLGQIVKVLVPGEGVALARVVYNPTEGGNTRIRGLSSVNQDITVVLISEPTNLAGSVITVPLNKILLAWPKV